MPRELESAFYTDTVRQLVIFDDHLLITTAGGDLKLTPSGMELKAPAEAFGELSAQAAHFYRHERQLKLNVKANCLVLIACRGRGSSYHHAIGELPRDWRQLGYESLVDLANVRLSAWHRSKK